MGIGITADGKQKMVMGVIMAKGESTRLPGKNLLTLGSQSLVELAIEAACESVAIDWIVVSSDDEEIGRVAESWGADWVRRPKEICKPDSDISEAAEHALRAYEASQHSPIDYVVSLQASVPVRPVGAIDALVEEVDYKDAAGGLSMIKRTPWSWEVVKGQACSPFRAYANGIKYPRSQDISRLYYEEINSIMVTRRDVCLSGKRWGTPLSIVEMPWWAAIDIDDEKDYEEAVEAWPFIESMMAKRVVLPTRTFEVGV